ncbi:MAG TPA: hypothetical protein VMT85_03890 [Thermoanaerobaculia bacterium]|nr:hypothetical protein [Thermoanaerobaculia bacterium]
MTATGGTARRGPAGELIVPARLFCDTSPGVGTQGEIAIGVSALTFQAGDAVTELPVAGLVARVAGFEDRTLFLSHPSQPGIEIATIDPAARTAPPIAALASLAASQHASRARRSRFWGCVVFAAIGVLLAALIAIVALGAGLDLVRSLL